MHTCYVYYFIDGYFNDWSGIKFDQEFLIMWFIWAFRLCGFDYWMFNKCDRFRGVYIYSNVIEIGGNKGYSRIGYEIIDKE